MAQAPVLARTEPLYTFPPFPTATPGVTIVAFKDFKPSGIQLFPHNDGEEEIELDGLNIPTVELRVKHDTDRCKSNIDRRRKKKKKESATDNPDVPARSPPWWEKWEQAEDLRTSSNEYNKSMVRADRLFQAQQAFTENRAWPPNYTGVRTVWDQFRLFIGLTISKPVVRKDRVASKITNVPADQELYGDSSDDDEAFNGVFGERGVRSVIPPGQSIQKNKASAEIEDDEELDQCKADAEEEREEQLATFFNDPVLSVKIFLSSYMREHGLIWAERNLINTPYLLGFFFRFLIRNRVLPEHESQLRRILEVIELASKELPLTFKIGQILPDKFSDACKESWGRKGGFGFQSATLAYEAPTLAKTPAEADSEFERELKAAHVDFIDPDAPENIVKQIIDDNIGADAALDTSAVAAISPAAADTVTDNRLTGGWGGTFSGGGEWNIPEGDNPWASAVSNPAEPTYSEWMAPRQSLLEFFDPSEVPLSQTHTTGIIESSTRRIKAIMPPGPAPPPRASATDNQPDPERIEEELDHRFAKVVLEPWRGRITVMDSDISRPAIKTNSRGAAICDPPSASPTTSTGVSTQAQTPTPAATPDGVRPHNPYEDEITLLVEPSLTENLSVGMGIGALWIQIARRQDVEPELLAQPSDNSKGREPGGSKGKRKKKGKNSKKQFWYLEDLMCTLPSFYTLMP